jgi:hypothetical protein
MKTKIIMIFCKIFHIKFSLTQDVDFINNGYDVIDLKQTDDCYFYGYYTDLFRESSSGSPIELEPNNEINLLS